MHAVIEHAESLEERKPDRPKPVFWETLLRQFPDLKRSEVAVVQAVHDCPWATDVEIGQAVNLGRQRVNEIRNSARFGEVLLAYSLKRKPLFTGKYLALMEMLLDQVGRRAAKQGIAAIDSDANTFLTLAGKSCGALEADQHLHFQAGGDQQVLIVSERLKQSIATVNGPFVTPKQAAASDGVPEKLSEPLR